jgi:extracellular elastinolytic metalloproteinase
MHHARKVRSDSPGRSGARGMRVAAIAAVAAVAVLATTSSSSAYIFIPEIDNDVQTFVDARATTAVPPSAEQLVAADRLGATVTWSRFGTPQSVIKHGGFLATGIEAAGAVQAARTFIDSNASLFALDSSADLEVVRSLARGERGHIVILRQRFGGLTANDGLVSLGLVRADGLWSIAYVSSSLARSTALSGATALSAADAWVASARSAGKHVSLVNVVSASRRAGWARLKVSGFKELQYVRPTAFVTPTRGNRRAYETIFVGGDVRDGALEAYRQIVDAGTGKTLFRESAIDYALDNPKWLVFPAYPHGALPHYPWNYPSSDIRDLWCWVDDPACKLSVANAASPREWDVNARTNTPTFTTIGNNADSQEEWMSASPHIGPGPNQFRPTSPTRDYVYPWTNVWFETLCAQSNFVPGVGNDISAAVTNLFVGHNRMHDWAYHLGFREETWNAQNFNFGKPTLENDELDGNAQAGAVTGGYPTYSGRDNAFMLTLPDGTRSVSSMFLWQPLAGALYSPCVDGDYDMNVIAHEYGHMIENRMIGKGFRRQGFHAGAMGESFGDLNAMEYLNEWNFVPTSGESPYVTGFYATSNETRGIRNYDMSWPAAGHFPEPSKFPQIDPLNLGAVGYDVTGAQVHADGEIWSATNFDLRELLLSRYPSHGTDINRECANGERPAQDCPGNRRWFQLYYDAMLLMPVAPTLLSARDAILAADVVRFGGANQDLLWLGFARRGFGQNATTTGPGDTDPVPDFESPLHDEATVVFNAVSEDTGAPVNANVYVGHYEARATPIADTNPATAGPNLDNVARFVPDDGAGGQNSRHRAYDFVANAAGYGHVRFRLTELKPGETRTVTMRFGTNYASTHNGAVAAGDGTNHSRLIDDTEGTQWESTGAPVQGRQVVIDLAGGAVTFRQIKVSAHLNGQNRFTALREFEVYACTAGEDRGNPTCAATNDDGWRRILKSQKDAFPGETPRPVAPELVLRTWEVPTTTATHVRLVVLNNQCTGNEHFQGEQDNDPANTTDCRVGALPALLPRGNDVRAAELEVLSVDPRVDGATQDD